MRTRRNKPATDIILTAEGAMRDNVTGTACVVIDVLRASTTMVTALANGCAGIAPVETPEEAVEVAAEKRCLLGGERNGEKISGFDLGNSPLEYTAENIFGRFLAFTTTNGTRAIRACAEADELLIGCFLNANALGKLLASMKKRVFIVCAGTRGEPSLEDTVCGGMLLDMLQGQRTEAGIEAVSLWQTHRHDLIGMMKRESRHGRDLVGLGFERDIEFAASIDKFNIIPVRHDILIVRKAP